MTVSKNPKLLNLDELELDSTDITIRHEGVDHQMRVLTVDMFIAQQKRADDHQKLVAAGKIESAEEVVEDAVTVIRDAILEFFPTLPVGELPTPKLFAIFAWLNELTAAINDAGFEDAESAEGNVETVETPMTTEI
jgi:hypothetical protein